MVVLRLAAALYLGLSSVAAAHEFWIEPTAFQVAQGAPVTAYLRNGEGFKGVSMAYFDTRFSRFQIVEAEGTRDVSGRVGDSPALQSQAGTDGLLVVLHETTPSTVIYRDWEKFLKFAQHKDFPDAAADHQKEGWSQSYFRESYTRHAKALIAVGTGAGSDRAFGLDTEFIALSNPYEPEFDGVMRVALAYRGAPRANAQIEVFARAPDGDVDISLHRTDGDGEASIPVQPGYSYLFDAVVLRPATEVKDPETDPVWETLWAALTFAVPAP